MTGELAFLSAVEQAELVRTGSVSPVELVETYLERIERLDPQLNAYVLVCADEALAAAEAAAKRQGGDVPPFHGVPFPIKDLTEVNGVRTTFGSKAFADYVPPRDTAVVRRVRDAGFILLGKTNTPEFGTTPFTEPELHGPTRNPWKSTLTPGGSSGGAAAAVVAGLAPAAHGSDGGGSIRIPASCCGIFGIKPARGRISNAPYGDGSLPLGTSGPLTRTVRDAAAILDVLSGYETGDGQWAPPPERPFVEEAGEDPGALRIALTTSPPVSVPVDPDCSAAAVDAAELLRELGHTVEEATPPWVADEFMPLFLHAWQLGPALYPVTDPALLEPVNRLFAERARATSSVDYARAVVQMQMFARDVVSFWRDWDLVLTPTLALPPVPIGWHLEPEEIDEQIQRSIAFTPFTAIANLTGQPAVSLPLHWRDDDVPIGVQLIGQPAGEAMLFRVSSQLEAARPWADQRPALDS